MTVEARGRVGAPLGSVYDALQEASYLPVLLEGVQDARPLPHATLLLAAYHGRSHAWEVNVVDQQEGRHITWDRIDGPGSAEVRLRPAGPRATDVTVLLYEVEDEEACVQAVERELAHLDGAIQALEQAKGAIWGVAGPW